jgi:cellulose biosynthesis protein BcsQ
VLTAEIISRVAHQEAPATGQGVTVYAPKSAAANEIRALAEEIHPVEVQNDVLAV